MSNAVMNIGIQLLKCLFSVLLGIELEVECLGHMVVLCGTL